MAWIFEKVAGPYAGAIGGLAWTGESLLFTAVAENQLLLFDPRFDTVQVLRNFTNGTSGIAVAPDGDLYGCQELSRRIVRFMRDGSTTVTAVYLDGQHHNQPNDLCFDAQGRIWFSDPKQRVSPSGPQIFPPLDHGSVLRLGRDTRGNWSMKRMTMDTQEPRAVLVSEDGATVLVSENGRTPDALRELRAYPVLEDDTLGQPMVLTTFGRDHRGVQRGIEGMCFDADGNIIACAGWRRSGAGPRIYVMQQNGAIIESHPVPSDLPIKCCFGGPELATLYVSTGDGFVYRVANSGRCGV